MQQRRDGGENHDIEGRISLAVTESMLAGNMTAANSIIDQVAADSYWGEYMSAFLRAIQAIMRGSRDRALADAPELDAIMASEVLYLIETLEKVDQLKTI